MIVAISFTTIRDEGAALLAEYADECSIPAIGRPAPQWQTYAMLEASGLFQAFAAVSEDQFVGFGTMLMAVLPHYGVKVATVESLFVSKTHRRTTAGRDLMDAMERSAKCYGCKAILYSAPTGGRLEKLLGKRCTCTNSVFCKPLSIQS